VIRVRKRGLGASADKRNAQHENAAMGRREASALRHNSAPRLERGAITMWRRAVPHPLGLPEGGNAGQSSDDHRREKEKP
jgi:hypothetical protein